MSGRRHVMDSTGSTYESCANFLIGRIASLVHVPREQDFGIDFYCQPRIPAGASTETVAELSSLQVKGGDAKLTYGGLNDHGGWREYEFTWLRSLATPLHLARVDVSLSAVELFSIWPLWLIFWRQVVSPFEVIFETQSAEIRDHEWREPQASPLTEGAGQGDGMRWTIDMGPPFLRLTKADLDDAGFRQQAISIFRTRTYYDRLMLMRYQQFIPYLTGITRWNTNSPQISEARTWQFWDSRPGANIPRLCQTASPILVNLGAHLQWQNDHAAYKLIPVLEWLDANGQLDPMGRGLLEGLRRTHARGMGPAEDLSGATGGKNVSHQRACQIKARPVRVSGSA